MTLFILSIFISLPLKSDILTDKSLMLCSPPGLVLVDTEPQPARGRVCNIHMERVMYAAW